VTGVWLSEFKFRSPIEIRFSRWDAGGSFCFFLTGYEALMSADRLSQLGSPRCLRPSLRFKLMLIRDTIFARSIVQSHLFTPLLQRRETGIHKTRVIRSNKIFAPGSCFYPDLKGYIISRFHSSRLRPSITNFVYQACLRQGLVYRNRNSFLPLGRQWFFLLYP
jgi:hypothetical protein